MSLDRPICKNWSY